MKRTNIYLADEELAALRMLGKRQERPVAELVREAVDEWLVKHGVSLIDEDEWSRRFDRLLDRRRQVADRSDWSADDVERDVAAAIAEVRTGNAARRH